MLSEVASIKGHRSECIDEGKYLHVFRLPPSVCAVVGHERAKRYHLQLQREIPFREVKSAIFAFFDPDSFYRPILRMPP